VPLVLVYIAPLRARKTSGDNSSHVIDLREKRVVVRGEREE
jgi:hypothetical protein